MPVLFPTITWTGAAGSGGTATWDTSSLNWSGPTGGTLYANGDGVIFTGTGANNNITISGTVTPASLEFSNGGTSSYTFSGAPIAGSAAVQLDASAGLVTFSSSNTYGGGTTISGGTLVAGGNTALGTGSVTVNSPGVLDLLTSRPSINGAERWRQRRDWARHRKAPTLRSSAAAAFSGGISQVASSTGSLTMAGTGSTLTLSGTNTYTGSTTITAGTLASASSAAVGSGAIALSGGGLSVTGPANYPNPVNVTASSLLNGSGTVNFGGNLSFSNTSTLSVAGGSAELHRHHEPQRSSRVQCPLGHES